MQNSNIEWTTHTFNPWEGCTKVSPGCLHCYAETRNKRWAGGVNWGKGAPRRRTSASNWREHVTFNDDGEGQGVAACRIGLNDTRKGGDIEEFPTELRVREFPLSVA